MHELLICKCGDCAHWEIGKDVLGNGIIECVTCGESHQVKIVVDAHDNLHYKHAHLPHKQKQHHGPKAR